MSSEGIDGADGNEDAEHDRMRAGRIQAAKAFRRARDNLQLAYIVFEQKLVALKDFGLPEFASEIDRLAALDAEAEKLKAPPQRPIEINIISRSDTETLDEMVARLEKFEALSIEEMGAEMKRLGIPEPIPTPVASWRKDVYELRKAVEQAASLDLVHDWHGSRDWRGMYAQETIMLAPVMDGRISESDALKKYMQDAARANAIKTTPAAGDQPDEDDNGMSQPGMA